MKNFPIKEITVFTDGDSNDLQVFSNVPFFFTRTLLSKGIQVNRIDISPNPFFQWIYRCCPQVFIKLYNPHSTYTYSRSLFHFYEVKRRIKKAVRQHPNTDLNLFLTFSFSTSKQSNQPVALFGDRTYAQVFKDFLNRKPDYFEQKAINRENNQIENADSVFVLFPKTAAKMKETYLNPNIFYLGNVINALYEPVESEIIRLKQDSQTLLFIGGPNYIEGAKCLIQSFKELKGSYRNLTLHIVGLSQQHVGEIVDDVCLHGYLDKGKPEDCELYYQLLKKAKIIINTTPKWSAFSSTLEAMHFYTPVITTPYEEFVSTFGDSILFGQYCEENLPALLTGKIITILDTEQYTTLCLKSHDAAKKFTWSNYIDLFLAQINKSLIL